MSKHILMIEDDEVRAKWVESVLHMKGLDVVVTCVTNEKEFLRRFEEWATAPPALVIIDQLLPYTTDEDDTYDQGALRLNAFEGGTRCHRVLHHDPRTAAVPTIFYTILDKERVPKDAQYVRKTGDLQQPELVAKVQAIIQSESALVH